MVLAQKRKKRPGCLLLSLERSPVLCLARKRHSSWSSVPVHLQAKSKTDPRKRLPIVVERRQRHHRILLEVRGFSYLASSIVKPSSPNQSPQAKRRWKAPALACIITTPKTAYLGV